MLRSSSLSLGAFLGTRFHLTNSALPVTHSDLISWNSVLVNSLEPGSISSQQGAMLSEPRASQRDIVYFDKISFVSRSHNYNGFTKAVLVSLGSEDIASVRYIDGSSEEVHGMPCHNYAIHIIVGPFCSSSQFRSSWRRKIIMDFMVAFRYSKGFWICASQLGPGDKGFSFFPAMGWAPRLRRLLEGTLG